MKITLIALTGAAIAVLLFSLFLALAPVQAEPAIPAFPEEPASEKAEVEHVGMGQNRPL